MWLCCSCSRALSSARAARSARRFAVRRAVSSKALAGRMIHRVRVPRTDPRAPSGRTTQDLNRYFRIICRSSSRLVIRVDLFVAELIEVLRPACADHLGDRMGPMRIDWHVLAEVGEDLGDRAAAALRRNPLDQPVGVDHVDHRDVAQRRDGEPRQVLGTLVLVERVLHQGTGLGEELRGGLLTVQAGPQTRHPDPAGGAGDDDCSGHQSLPVVHPAPEGREKAEDQREGSDDGRLRERGTHRSDHRWNRQQADEHQIPADQGIDDDDPGGHQHRDHALGPRFPAGSSELVQG